jgi:hypothetical protein
MADTAAGIVGWLDSSIAARNAATNHDAGHGTVSKTS